MYRGRNNALRLVKRSRNGPKPIAMSAICSLSVCARTFAPTHQGRNCG